VIAAAPSECISNGGGDFRHAPSSAIATVRPGDSVSRIGLPLVKPSKMMKAGTLSGLLRYRFDGVLRSEAPAPSSRALWRRIE
jgi:hypothetical protein